MNFHALHLFCEETGTTLTGIDKALQDDILASLPKLTYAGIRTHYALVEEEVPVTFQKYAILFGSIDWAPIAEQVGKALNLSEKKAKATTVRSRK